MSGSSIAGYFTRPRGRRGADVGRADTATPGAAAAGERAERAGGAEADLSCPLCICRDSIQRGVRAVLRQFSAGRRRFGRRPGTGPADVRTTGAPAVLE